MVRSLGGLIVGAKSCTYIYTYLVIHPVSSRRLVVTSSLSSSDFPSFVPFLDCSLIDGSFLDFAALQLSD